MAVALMSVNFGSPRCLCKSAGMSLTAVAEEGSDIISITGTTTSNIGAVTITVKTPDGSNLQAIGQETPDANGEFSTEFNVSNWKQDGMYKIQAQQGEYTTIQHYN